MYDLWLVTEVHSLLYSGELQEPGNGHVVKMVHIKMGKMNLRAYGKKKQQRNVTQHRERDTCRQIF